MFYLVQLLLIKTHHTAQKNKFSIKDFFSECDQIRNLVTFAEEILNGKLIFLCSVICYN